MECRPPDPSKRREVKASFDTVGYFVQTCWLLQFLLKPLLFGKGFIGFEIRRIQIQISGLVICAVPFPVDPKLLVR